MYGKIRLRDPKRLMVTEIGDEVVVGHEIRPETTLLRGDIAKLFKTLWSSKYSSIEYSDLENICTNLPDLHIEAALSLMMEKDIVEVEHSHNLVSRRGFLTGTMRIAAASAFVATVTLPLPAAAGSIGMVEVFSTPGTFSSTVPAGATNVNVTISGGAGGGGGAGGRESATGTAGHGGNGGAGQGSNSQPSVTPSDMYTINVGRGGQGANGGGNGPGAVGGSAGFGGSVGFQTGAAGSPGVGGDGGGGGGGGGGASSRITGPSFTIVGEGGGGGGGGRGGSNGFTGSDGSPGTASSLGGGGTTGGGTGGNGGDGGNGGGSPGASGDQATGGMGGQVTGAPGSSGANGFVQLQYFN